MTGTATKIYSVGVIERAITYFKIEAEDARTAAENWSDGEFEDCEDEALDDEGPCTVHELQPDGTWRKLPRSEWEDPPAVASVAPGARFEINDAPAQNGDRAHVMVDRIFNVAIIRTDEGIVVDIYPKDGTEPVASTYAFRSEVEAHEAQPNEE
jgi:hypothetical protein